MTTNHVVALLLILGCAHGEAKPMTQKSRITGAVLPVDGKCPKCGKPLERRVAQFFWRGRYFHGLVCCNALWNDPTDSFEDHVLSDMAPARE